MALKETITDEFGIDRLVTYHRIYDVAVQGESLNFRVLSKRGVDLPAFKDEMYSCPYNGGDPTNIGYDYIKTLPEFANSVDC